MREGCDEQQRQILDPAIPIHDAVIYNTKLRSDFKWSRRRNVKKAWTLRRGSGWFQWSHPTVRMSMSLWIGHRSIVDQDPKECDTKLCEPELFYGTTQYCPMAISTSTEKIENFVLVLVNIAKCQWWIHPLYVNLPLNHVWMSPFENSRSGFAWTSARHVFLAYRNLPNQVTKQERLSWRQQSTQLLQ